MLKRKITKRRNNRKRKNTQRLRRKPRKYVGGMNQRLKLLAYHPPPSITFCPGCTEFQTLKLKSAEPISIDKMPTFTCNCGFKVDNYIVYHLINVCQATKYTDRKNPEDYKRDAQTALNTFNEVFNKLPKYKAYELQVLITDTDPEKKKELENYYTGLDHIRNVANGYGMDIGRLTYGETTKLLRWLPLKNSQFYKESVTNVFKALG